MSAPTVACVLAEHVGTMLQQISGSIGARVRIEYSQHTTNPFHVFIEDGLQTFHGDDTDAGRALMAANSKRQDWQERLAARPVATNCNGHLPSGTGCGNCPRCRAWEAACEGEDRA